MPAQGALGPGGLARVLVGVGCVSPTGQCLSSGSPCAWRGSQEHWESTLMATLSGEAAGEILN